MATKTTTGTGGDFSVGSTWVGGVAPSAGDDIVVAAGATLTLDTNFNAASVTMQADSVFNQAVVGTYYVDCDGPFTIAAGCYVGKLTINSLTGGSGYVEITTAAGGSVSLINCTILIPLNLNAGAANAVDFAGSTIAELTVGTPAGSTITGGEITLLNDDNMLATGTLYLVGVTIGNLVCSTALLTVLADSCTFAAVTLEKMDFTATDCEIQSATCTGNSSVLGTFDNCTCELFSLAVNSEIGDSTLDFANCTFDNCAFQGYSASSRLLVNVSGTATVFTSVYVNGYGVLTVNDALPDTAWFSVSVAGLGSIRGYVLASAISWGTGAYIGSADSHIYVKYPLNLDGPVLEGGNWYLYESLSFTSSPTYTAAVYFNLMKKSAQLTNNYEVVQYGGLAGPPSPAYRGLI